MNLKNLLYQNNFNCLINSKQKQITLFLFFTFQSFYYSQGIANYVNNGGFEDFITCSLPNPITRARFWAPIDSLSGGTVYYNSCSGIQYVPYSSYTFQFPRTGDAFISSDFYCQASFCTASYNRGYFRNRLKNFLQNGETYCVKFYVNISNNSTIGIDRFEAYFGNSPTIDTITKCTLPLTYLTPQIQNPTNNIIGDTLNWTLVTGTFVANGTEKYMIIGNFKSDVATNTLLINPAFLPARVTDVAIDDVSCIDINLPAYAGPDIWCIPGNSVYIGRPSDVGIDEDCMWYKLPNMAVPIATVAGLLVSPVVTTTYVVKQDICGIIKYDTVVVHQSATGINELDILKDRLSVYPVPAKDELNLSLPFDHAFSKITITNNLGQLIREEEVVFKDNAAKIKTNDLANGVYFFTLKDQNSFSISKRFVITR